MKKNNKVLAFYFAPDDGKLRYGDGRKVEVGVTHKVEGKLELCAHGLYASTKVSDALKYAPGRTLYLVELSGDVFHGDDKLCASERTYLKCFDAEALLREFARKQALINIDKIRPYCSEKDFSVIKTYLEHGRKEDRSAARFAAWSAARSAARSAAESAVWSAAESAARSAARSAANKMLTAMIREATGWEF